MPGKLRRIGTISAALGFLVIRVADAAIGRTPGIASVTADGEAAYSIPLALPPGTNGMTPAISLEYRHRSQGGLLGVGWSIGGLSQIARCPRTLAQDGISSRVTQTAADRFCLDGQRLVVVNGATYGGAGAEYRTEIESFARIRSFDGPGIGPQYFVVEAADGRIFEYGATPDSRVDGSSAAAHPVVPAWIWALNRIRDRSGNVIDFDYVEDIQNGGLRVNSIRYNSNPAGGIAASHQVAFVYGSRPGSDVDTAYVAGTPVRQVARLDRIDVLYDGTILRRYGLSYEPAPTTSGRSRLAAVTECGAGAAECRAATTFVWQDGTTGLGKETAFAAAVPSSSPFPESHLWNTADINGDGRIDYLWAGGSALSSARIHYRLGLAGGSFGPDIDSGISCPYGIGVPFDSDGDGHMDLLTLSASRVWSIVPGNGGGLGTPVSTGIPVPAQMVDFRGADLNGDGLGDIAWSEHVAHQGNSLEVRVRYAMPGGGFSPAPITLYVQAEAVGYQTAEGGDFLGRPGRRIDLDGDGAEELLMNENYTIARIGAHEHATDQFDGSFYGGAVLDFNGDGCDDFAYKHYTQTLRVRISGCGIAWSGPELLGPVSSDAASLGVMDWNGDGRDDLLLRGATNWRVATSNGESLPAIADTGIAHRGSTGSHAADADGDGLADLVIRAAGKMRLRLRTGPKADLLLSATDGFGVAARFTYLPLTDSSVYVRGDAAVYPEQDMQTAAQVVASLAVSDGSGTGSMRTSSYRYEGLRRQLLGRGWLGFKRVIRTDPSGGEALDVELTQRQDYPYTGLPRSIVVRRPSGQPVAASDYRWTSLDLGNGPGARHFPHLSQVTTDRYGVGGTLDGARIAALVLDVGAIDPVSGTITDRTTTITEIAGGANPLSSSNLRVVRTGVLNDVASWCLGRTRGSQLSASHTLGGGEPITRSFSQDWDGPKCRPVLRRIEPGDSQWQVDYRLAYDAFGNVAGLAVEGAGMEARTTTIDWGARGQSPVRVIDPLSQPTQFSWDLGGGLLLAVTDPNALTLQWEYDAFGEPVEESQADGTSTTWSRAACTTACDPRARWRLSQQDRDSAGLVHRITLVDFDRFGRAIRTARQQPGGGYSISAVDTDPEGRPWRLYLPFWDGSTPPGYWQYSYDLIGRPTEIALHAAAGNLERSHSLRYEGLAMAQTDALGRTTTGTASAWGPLVQMVDAAGNRTHYEYDAFGDLLRVTDAADRLVADIRYNSRGMMLSQADPDLGEWFWTRNALGEPVALRDAKDQVFGFSFDALGRMTRRATPDGISTLTWGSLASKHEIGRLARMDGPGYSERLSYDSAGRPATHTIVTDASYRYDFSYNALGLLDTLTYPSAGTNGRLRLDHEYDAGRLARISYRDLSRLARLTDPAGTVVPVWRLNAADAAGNPIDESLGAAIHVVTGIDPLTGDIDYRQTTADGGASAQDLAYGWDDNGNLVRREDRDRGLVESFGYDALDRLVEARRNGEAALGLDYDATGNILWKSDVCAGTAPCYSYDASRRHAVTSAGGVTYGYDANGNMINRAGSAIGWTSDNLPESIAYAGGSSSRFWYGPGGNRWKQVALDGGTTETTLYAGEWMEKVTRGGSTTWRHYLMGPTGTAAVQLRYGNGAQPAMRFLTRDHLGSIDRVLESSGAIIAAESFDAFGQRRRTDGSGPLPAPDLALFAAATRDGYTGHEHLDHVGLIHMNGRIYDPRLARFASADPYVSAPFDSQGFNRYAYVRNNPLSYTDPSGFEGEPPCMQTQQGKCAQITVIGVTWAQYRQFVGGAGFSQMESGSQRNPCGQESSALACAMQNGRLASPASIVLTAGSRPDPTLARGNAVEWLQGAAARLGNLAIGSSPVAMLFGADPDFEWFEVPDSPAGQAGAAIGNAGYFVGGAAGMLRRGGSSIVGTASSQFARSLQGTAKYPGIDRFKDIVLKKGTILYAGYPGQSPFYTTASALRRSGWSAESLFRGVQLKRHRDLGYRSTVAAYEVVADTPAAFGLAIANAQYGAGWLPQVVVPSYATSLRLVRELPLGP